MKPGAKKLCTFLCKKERNLKNIEIARRMTLPRKQNVLFLKTKRLTYTPHGSCHFFFVCFIIINNHAKPLVLVYFRFHERIRFSDFDCRAIMRLQVLRSVSVRSLMLSGNLKI